MPRPPSDSRSSAIARSPYSVGGRPVLPLPQRPLAGLLIVSEDYFRLMRIRFVAGRAFRADDRAWRARRLHRQRIAREARVPRRVAAREDAAARARRRDRAARSSA